MLTCALTAFLTAAPAAAAQSPIGQLDGDAAGDHFGWSLAFVGDVDGDGSSDLAVGAPFHDAAGPDAGRVKVFSGSTLQLIRTWEGPAAGVQFGFSLAGVGDHDGDGRADVLVGAGYWQGYSFTTIGAVTPGGARLISGATGTVLRSFAAPPGITNFGYAVAGGEDLDGDAFPDLLIGAPGKGWDDTGYVYVYSGATGNKIRRDGLSGAVSFGAALAFLGDVDGDLRCDYAVGAPTFLGCATPGGKGQVVAFSGASGAELWTIEGTSIDDQLGWALANVGDLDGDSVADLAVGLRNKGDCWVACQPGAFLELRSGADGSSIRTHPETSACGAYGTSSSTAGDLNGDGREEYIGGEPGWAPWLDTARQLRVFDGATGAELAALPNPQVGGKNGWGFSLAAGDANGDGLVDLVIGSPWYDGIGIEAGRVSIQTIVRAPTVYCQAQVNSQGCLPTIVATGVPSASSSTFLVSASNLLNQKSGLLFWGTGPKLAPFGGGFKCVLPPTVRTPVQSSGGNPPPDDCSGVLSFPWTSGYLASKGLGPGSEVFCQFWSRDPQSASTTNLTGGLAFFVLP